MMGLLLVLLLSQQTKVTNTTTGSAIATRCVNAAGTAFEACGGGSSSSASWFPDGGVIGAVTQSTSPWVVSLISTTITGSVAVTGTFWQATQPVSGPLTDTQLRASAVPVSLTSTTITGTVAATQSGTWSDRVVGSAGGAFDAANNATAPANVLVMGAQLQSGASPTVGTAGQVGSVAAGLDHVLYTRPGGPVQWSCLVQAVTATTQCQAASGAGLKNYVTGLSCSNQAATAQTVDVVYGTGAACVTGTTALTHKFQMGTNATTTSPFESDISFTTPLQPAAANAICLRPSAATAFGCTLTGFTAP